MTTNNREEVTQEQLDQLIEDASYLQDEAEALKYVIDEVPYTEAPPEGKSIAEMLLLVDHAQLSYYRPVIEDTIDNPRPTHLKHFEHFRESFVLDEEKARDIQKVLNKIAKHRAGLVNVLKNIPLIDWEATINSDGQKLTLYDFVLEMIRFERSLLKEIADLVMVFNQEKETRRALGKKAQNSARPGNEEQEG